LRKKPCPERSDRHVIPVNREVQRSDQKLSDRPYASRRPRGHGLQIARMTARPVVRTASTDAPEPQSSRAVIRRVSAL
jgi:hypothetical protein